MEVVRRPETINCKKTETESQHFSIQLIRKKFSGSTWGLSTVSPSLCQFPAMNMLPSAPTLLHPGQNLMFQQDNSTHSRKVLKLGLVSFRVCFFFLVATKKKDLIIVFEIMSNFIDPKLKTYRVLAHILSTALKKCTV